MRSSPACARRSERWTAGRPGDPDPGRAAGLVRWLIDGMNLIGSRPDRWWNDPDRAIRALIEELGRYAAATGEEVTVVFDRRPPDLAPGTHGAVRVLFASWRGRNAADHGIVRMVSEDPAPASIRVVTSDRRLVGRVCGNLPKLYFRTKLISRSRSLFGYRISRSSLRTRERSSRWWSRTFRDIVVWGETNFDIAISSKTFEIRKKALFSKALAP